MRLPSFSREHWRDRWLTAGHGTLHRVASIIWDDGDRGEHLQGSGATACGRILRLQAPGLLSRLGAPRCALCCRVAGVPRGHGAPHNQGIQE